jgi:lysophospholipase L1-like esterase
METDADRVFVFGGTNDFGHGSLHLGTPWDREVNTFCYELRLLIERLSEKYGSERITFMLPIHRYDEEPKLCKGVGRSELGKSFSEYISLMRAIISEYGIDIIDLYENGIPKPAVNTGDAYTVDGVHPTDLGHSLIADRVCEYLRNK